MAAPTRARWAALALALAVAAASTAAAAAQAACAPGLTAAQCKVCASAASPTKCHACVAATKGAASAASAAAATCMVCASLASADAQDFCTSCAKAHGPTAGCSSCAAAALFSTPEGGKPTAKGLATAGGCFSCYNKAGTELQSTPACAACYGPRTKDPEACVRDVRGDTGLPAAARPAAFACHLDALADAGACKACLGAAKSTAGAQLCALCAGAPGGKAEQGACFTCMDKVSAALPGVRFLCHVTGTAQENKALPALTAAVPRYYACLAAAKALADGQACRKAMDQIEKGTDAAAAFKALGA